MWFWHKISEYVILKNKQKLEDELIKKNEKEGSSMSKNDASATSKKKKKKKSGLMKFLKDDMDKYLPTVVMWQTRILMGI
jgi:hypothetical protein